MTRLRVHRKVNSKRSRHENRAHYWLLFRLWTRDRAPLPRAGLERGRHHANAARRHSAPVGAAPRSGARRDEAREHCRRDRGVRAHRRARQQRGHRSHRRLRGHADGDGARGVRDQHLRCDGDDAGGAASASRAAVGCGGERDLERDADADAAGGRVHREQDGDRRVHRIARARARGVQRAGQTGRAGLRPDHALHEQRGIAHGRAVSRGIRGVHEAHPRVICAGDDGDDGVDVAEAVYRAANDASGQLRFPAGPDAVALAQAG